MSDIGNIAAVASFFSLLFFGVLIVVRGEGYSFDLRRKPRRRILGGRRVTDR